MLFCNFISHRKRKAGFSKVFVKSEIEVTLGPLAAKKLWYPIYIFRVIKMLSSTKVFGLKWNDRTMKMTCVVFSGLDKIVYDHDMQSIETKKSF